MNKGGNIKYFKWLVILKIFCPVIVKCIELQVTTKSGTVQGLSELFEDQEYIAFKGIPFAKPPVGDLRFKGPVPSDPWTGILNATENGPLCPQQGVSEDKMSEDCLSLNVYVPVIKDEEDSNLLPVLVWIHGGEFKFGSASENSAGPQYFMSKKVIFVSINYRLGALGFMSLGIEEAPGNTGLKDVVLSLQWVKQNIESFGGDHKSVTIGGQSAGSGIVQYMLLTEKTRGLFQRAIMQSGSAFSFRFFRKNYLRYAYALGSRVNIKNKNKTQIVNKLREIPYQDFLKFEADMTQNDNKGGFRPFAPFVPIAEQKSDDAFITKSPRKIMDEGIPQNVPIIVGLNGDEGLKMLPVLLNKPKLIEFLNKDYQKCVPDDMHLPHNSRRKKKAAQEIIEFYFGNDTINEETHDAYIKLIGDTQFLHPIDEWVRSHSNNAQHQPIYYYMCHYDDELNKFKIEHNITQYSGTSHADDLGYLMVSAVTQPYLSNLSESARNLRDRLVEMWTNFIYYGNPTPASRNSSILETEWKPIEDSNIVHMTLNYENEMIEGRPYEERAKFWQDLYNNVHSDTY